ncbi:hypothetical protein CYMTET_32944, partial [Cymbomonas tetramitiformis]
GYIMTPAERQMKEQREEEDRMREAEERRLLAKKNRGRKRVVDDARVVALGSMKDILSSSSSSTRGVTPTEGAEVRDIYSTTPSTQDDTGVAPGSVPSSPTKATLGEAAEHIQSTASFRTSTDLGRSVNLSEPSPSEAAGSRGKDMPGSSKKKGKRKSKKSRASRSVEEEEEEADVIGEVEPAARRSPRDSLGMSEDVFPVTTNGPSAHSSQDLGRDSSPPGRDVRGKEPRFSRESAASGHAQTSESKPGRHTLANTVRRASAVKKPATRTASMLDMFMQLEASGEGNFDTGPPPIITRAKQYWRQIANVYHNRTLYNYATNDYFARIQRQLYVQRMERESMEAEAAAKAEQEAATAAAAEKQKEGTSDEDSPAVEESAASEAEAAKPTSKLARFKNAAKKAVINRTAPPSKPGGFTGKLDVAAIAAQMLEEVKLKHSVAAALQKGVRTSFSEDEQVPIAMQAELQPLHQERRDVLRRVQ